MSGIVLVGLLSGMIFGALAMLMRRFASFIILAPVIALPTVYLFMWRDALVGHCFFARHFNTPACSPLHTLISTTLEHAGDAVVVVIAHILVAFATVFALSALRMLIARADLSSPQRKEAMRRAHDEQVKVQMATKKRLEEQMEAATRAILASQGARGEGTLVQAKAADAAG